MSPVTSWSEIKLRPDYPEKKRGCRPPSSFVHSTLPPELSCEADRSRLAHHLTALPRLLFSCRAQPTNGCRREALSKILDISTPVIVFSGRRKPTISISSPPSPCRVRDRRSHGAATGNREISSIGMAKRLVQYAQRQRHVLVHRVIQLHLSSFPLRVRRSSLADADA